MPKSVRLQSISRRANLLFELPFDPTKHHIGLGHIASNTTAAPLRVRSGTQFVVELGVMPQSVGSSADG